MSLEALNCSVRFPCPLTLEPPNSTSHIHHGGKFRRTRVPEEGRTDPQESWLFEELELSVSISAANMNARHCRRLRGITLCSHLLSPPSHSLTWSTTFIQILSNLINDDVTFSCWRVFGRPSPPRAPLSVDCLEAIYVRVDSIVCVLWLIHCSIPQWLFTATSKFSTFWNLLWSLQQRSERLATRARPRSLF